MKIFNFFLGKKPNINPQNITTMSKEVKTLRELKENARKGKKELIKAMNDASIKAQEEKANKE